jgi:hypothetical protein
MKILKKKSVADVARQWKEQYHSGYYWNNKFPQGDVTAKELHDIIANRKDAAGLDGILSIAWTTYLCDCCGERVDTAVEWPDIGAGDSVITVCFNCVEEMSNLVKENNNAIL